MQRLTFDPEIDSIQDPVGFYKLLAADGFYVRRMGIHLLATSRFFERSCMDLDTFVQYCTSEHNLYIPVRRADRYDPERNDLLLVQRPLRDYLWVPTQKLVNDMPTTPEREENNEKFQKSLETKKLNTLSKANRSTLAHVKDSLSESQMAEYADTKSAVLEMVHAGKLKEMSDLDIERFVLMKMIETRGLVDMLRNAEGELTREALTYWELIRKFGIESQNLLDKKSETKKSAKSAFDTLKELADEGYDIAVRGKENTDIIDVDYVEHSLDNLDEPEVLDGDDNE